MNVTMASVSILDTLSPAQLAQFYSNLLDTNDPIFVFNCTVMSFSFSFKYDLC